MFEFKYVELMNWAYWPTIRVPMDQATVMISGPNGSGKTTFLDALRTLLRVPRLSSNRRFTNYLIGDVEIAAVKGVVTNLPQNGDGRRPFEFRGFTDDTVTLAVIMQRRAGRWERRFGMLNGDNPLSAFRELSRSELLAPETYSGELHRAGFSDALLRVLALEQGQTDKLCEKSPRELLNLLLDVHGDKSIIERYQHARENYQAASLEVSHLGARLAEEQSKLLAAERAAEAYHKYRKLEEEQAEFENVLLPQSEYRATREMIAEAELMISDINMRLHPLDREIVEVQARLENVDVELAQRKDQVVQAREAKEQLDQEERALDLKLNSLLEERRKLDKLLAVIEDASVEPLEPLRKALEQTRRRRIQLELRAEEKQQQRQSLENDQTALNQPRQKIYPPQVQAFRHLLRDEKIDFSMLCDCTEITVPDWQLAIESILGRDRFCVMVDEKDLLRVRKLGEKHRYRAYVVSRHGGRRAASCKAKTAQSALGVVEFSEDGIPAWVVDTLNRTMLVETVKDGMSLPEGTVSITRNGYRQDRRGGISVAVDRFFCGDLGQSTQLAENQAELSKICAEIARLRREADAAHDEMVALQRRIEIQEGLSRASQAEARRAQLDEEITRINGQHHQALELKRQGERRLLDRLDELNHFEHECDEQRRWLLEQRGNQNEILTDLQEYQEKIATGKQRMRELESKLDPALLTDKALQDIAPVDELTPRYYAVQRLLEEYEEPPDQSVVAIYQHHYAQFEQQQQTYRDHESGLRNWDNEFQQARQKYIVVVEHTIREYRRNVLSLAAIAGVHAEVIMPSLHEAEDSLETAELIVRFGYDGKRAQDIRNAGHSGGQRVVSSLILLMALATSGGTRHGGFFIIDEPFAHLSIERIDDVSRFLEKTQCQFILTSPTSHNVNVFSAARLQMNFRIKARDADFAPAPTIIRR